MYQVYNKDTGTVVRTVSNPTAANAIADREEEASSFDLGHSFGVRVV